MFFFRKRKFIQSLGQQFTPDMSKVEDSEHKLVFLNDDILPGYQHHHKIEKHLKVVSRGFTQQHFDYRVGKHTGKAVPFHVNKDGGLKVKGKICAVESRAIPILDNHYRNGVEFARVRTHIIVVDRDHQIMSIGNEEFLRHLPPGMIRTMPELGIRHYTSNPLVGLVGMYMYVAMRAHWEYEDFTHLPREIPTFPQQPTIWLPKYYRYPQARNKCQK
jgi:hypothetical protein